MDDHGVTSALDQDALRIGDRAPIPDSNTNGQGQPVTAAQNNPCCDWWRDPPNRTPSQRFGSYFGGPHPGGMNSCFGDGSVRFIRFAVSQATFANLCRRDDGNVIGTDF